MNVNLIFVAVWWPIH